MTSAKFNFAMVIDNCMITCHYGKYMNWSEDSNDLQYSAVSTNRLFICNFLSTMEFESSNKSKFIENVAR